MTQSAYDIYCLWCRDRNQPPPTRDFFFRESNPILPWTAPSAMQTGEVKADQREVDRERREGWSR